MKSSRSSSGQIGMETMIGAAIFLVFLIAVLAYTSSQSRFIDERKVSIYEEAACDSLAQAIREVKNSSLKWAGRADMNFYLNDDLILVNYNPSDTSPFSGVFCSTEPTKKAMQIVTGDLNISYTHKSGFTFKQ
ncbi:MAG: hypothetical protein AABW59_01505 [archaeon]